MRRVLIVVDMQKDFIDGALGTTEAQAIVKPVLEKMKTYENSDIYLTRDTHGENYLETAEGRKLPVVHCVRHTEGWRLHPEIEKQAQPSHIIDKPSFGSMELMELLCQENKKESLEIELVGLCTDICVVSNALLLKAAMPENRIRVDAGCCAGVTPASHQAALLTMEMCQIEIDGNCTAI
ncbi:MAG: cysteine hydrolase [Lachnospiraceae bacterium]|nr:cysteine hydrolase [Lachnospiraceae bacterium]